MLTTEEIRQFMEEDNVSQKKQFARKGQEYYDGDHDIRHYRMFYYNEDGNLVGLIRDIYGIYLYAAIIIYANHFLCFQILLQFAKIVTFEPFDCIYRMIEINQIIGKPGSHQIVIIDDIFYCL